MVAAVKKQFSQIEITAVGTNSETTSVMLKAGADHVATGENAVVVGCRNVDLIVDPIGIMIADSLYGEITPAMATAVGQSSARQILIPMNHCDNAIVRVDDLSIGRILSSVLEKVKEYMEVNA